jgi:MBG domain (YGX type)/Galactose oxidase, central domain/Kelch motif
LPGEPGKKENQMQRAMKLMLGLLGAVSLLCGGFVVLRGTVPPASINAWLPAGSLSATRASASTVLLPDGRLLVTGGNDASGPLATTDILDTSGNFIPGAPMHFARSSHMAVTLQDGRVLVAGGTGADGRPTDTAEIFDPAANTWSMPSPLLVPRSGATATLLPDGRVLVAGGVSSGGPTNTLEIYDPASGTFSAAAGVLSSARQNHAATLLPSGQVLIAGGSDGTQARATSDIFDSSTGVVSLGPVLRTARSSLTATTLIDGTVLVAGGTTTAQDGSSQDLASLEILSPGSTAFTLASASLAAPRSGQSAFLLPHNASVLFVGGTSNGTALNSSELYLPWAGAFAAPATLSSPRSLLTGSPLATDGMVLVAGGSDGTNSLATTEVYGFATVKTDAADYAPGTTVTITGSGWQPGETVTLSFLELPLIDTPTPQTAVADADGNIYNTGFVPDQYDIGVRFYLTAIGNASQAQTTFTDDNPNASIQVTASPAGAVGGAFSITRVLSNGNTQTSGGTTTQTFGGTLANSSFSIASIQSPVNGCTYTGPSTVNGTAGGANTTTTVTLTYSCPGGAAPTTLTVSPASGTYGGTVDLSATLTKTSDSSAVSGKTISFTLNGNPVGSATTSASGVASLTSISLSGINANTYPTGVGASFAGDSGYALSSGTASLTITKAPLTVTADNKTMILHDVLPTFTATFSGFKNGETLATSGVTGTPSLTTTATSASPVGTYPIVAALGTLAANNYSFTFVNGTLTIAYSTGACLGDLGHTILQPIDHTGTSIFKQKSTVPAKFRVCDANNVSIGTPGVITLFQVGTSPGTYSDTINETYDISTTPDTVFRWDPTGQQWIYNTSTKTLKAGNTYYFQITLDDGSTIMYMFGLR